MLDFLFKRRSKTTSDKLAATSQSAQSGQQQQQEQISHRQHALQQLQTISQDEEAVLKFLLACEFADGRLQAAQHLHAKPVLLAALPAMRKSDKRVTKLLQQKLDALLQGERLDTLAQECIVRAEYLQQVAPLLANQVAELDRQAAQYEQFPAPGRERYRFLRQQLEQRLLTQAELQRRLRDLCQQIRQGEGELAVQQDAFSVLQQHSEATSIPKNYAHDVEQALRAVQIEQAAVAEHHARELAEQAEREAAERDAAARTAFEACADATAETPVEQPITPSDAIAEMTPPDRERITALLEAMSTALDEGSVQRALVSDQTLHEIEHHPRALTTKQKAHLRALRAELHRLRSWARWGGSVSRDELIRAAEDLPKQELLAHELAKRIGGLRERWKSLDASGPSGKEVWQRFDGACNAAYAQATAQFEQLAQERIHNHAVAQALVVELRGQTMLLQVDEPDWKGIAQLCQYARNRWRDIGAIDRKLRTVVERDFEQALGALHDPLQAAREQEILLRKSLIEQVQTLSAHAQGCIDQVRTIQEQWQQRTKRVPLLHKDEQALWQQLRESCDALFAARKEQSAAARLRRQDVLAQKEAICVELEQCASDELATVRRNLSTAAQGWDAAGDTTQQGALEQRYRVAVQRLQQRADHIVQEKKKAEHALLMHKLNLCWQREAEHIDEKIAALEASWAACEAFSSPLETTLQKRWQAAPVRDAGAVLAQFDKLLLQMEIRLGLPSPATLAQQRLTLQVEALQASLKNGRHGDAIRGQLQILLGLPVPLDENRRVRLQTVIESGDR